MNIRGSSHQPNCFPLGKTVLLAGREYRLEATRNNRTVKV